MIGKINTSGGEKLFTIKFEVNDPNAAVTVKDEGVVVQPVADKTYKLGVASYTYDITGTGEYQYLINQKLNVVKDATIQIELVPLRIVSFNVTPVDATFTLYDNSNKVVNTTSTGLGLYTYKIKDGLYKYSASADGYNSLSNVAITVDASKDRQIISVNLSGKIYGVRRQISNSSSAWTRIEASEGLVANAVKSSSDIDTTRNDFDSKFPWSDIKTCDVLPNGTVSSYYGDPTFNAASPKGHIMVEIPEFWYKREQTGGEEYIRIAREDQGGYTKAKKRYVGKYDAGGSSSALNSKSGVDPVVSITIADARTAAKKIGTNWGLMDIETWSIIEMLYLVEFADYDCQKIVGYGVSNASAKINSGECNSIGNKSGYLTNDKKHAVVYRGMENLWGNVFQWLDGVNFDDEGQAWISRNQSDYSSGTAKSPYTKLGYVCPNTGGYVKEVGYDPANPDIQLPKTYGGSDSTYVSDYSGSSIVVVCVGGYWYGEGSCGLWYFNSYSVSRSFSDIGCRLLYIPK